MKTQNQREDTIGEKQFDLHIDDGSTEAHPRTKKIQPKAKTSGLKYFSLAGQLGFDIALPMAAGLIIGTKLDERWGTQPKATIGLFLVGLGLSCASLIRIVQDVTRKR